MQGTEQRRRRRVHSVEFKAQVLAQCAQPGASVAAVALANGVNANLVRKWLIGRGLKSAGLATPQPRASGQVAAMQFVPVQVQAPAAPAAGGDAVQPRSIHIELRRGPTQLTVSWPAQDALACAAWLRQIGAAVLG